MRELLSVLTKGIVQFGIESRQFGGCILYPFEIVRAPARTIFVSAL